MLELKNCSYFSTTESSFKKLSGQKNFVIWPKLLDRWRHLQWQVLHHELSNDFTIWSHLDQPGEDNGLAFTHYLTDWNDASSETGYKMTLNWMR